MSSSLRFLALGLTLLPACTLARGVVATDHDDASVSRVDSGREMDAGPSPDTGTDEDAWVDPGVDAWTGEDAYVEVVDAGTDAYVTPDAYVGPRGCGAIYGAAEGFHGCVDEADRCEFVTTLYFVTTCNTRCEERGGTCIDAFANGGSDGCTHSGNLDCGTFGPWDALCVCSHPP